MVALIGALLAGCSAPPTEQEQTMTPEESKQALVELMSSTYDLMALSEEGWDPEYPLAADPCTLSNGTNGINYIDVRTWTGDVEATELIDAVRDSWTSEGLSTELDVRRRESGGSDYWLVGRGESVENIRIVIIPGQVTFDGESTCVVGEL
ncbi:hypothetical protein ACFVAJ_03470 [Agromyces sp. NPDC057679]|uniref:hypothetical protein n=1 Tax=Agromyces sp. NPDC057679 TaxID=3346207 RepID=UPI00366DFD71